MNSGLVMEWAYSGNQKNQNQKHIYIAPYVASESEVQIEADR